MRLSKKYPVPPEFALLYEFVNSIDLRRFIEQGKPHVPNDELASIPQTERWMRARHLLEPSLHITAVQHREALKLRRALRGFFAIPPAKRLGNKDVVRRLNEPCECYPLVVKLAAPDTASLQPAPGNSGLGHILAQLFLLVETGRLERMKVCASDECNWIFFDRSKPGTRRWCSAVLCGNRHKTRAYRQRNKRETSAASLIPPVER